MFFSVVRPAVQMHTKNVFKMWLKKTHSWKNVFLHFLLQNLNVSK